VKRNNTALLAFDYGLRQIGVAVGNSELGTCQPLAIIRAKDGTPDWDAVGRCLREWQPGHVLVGEPLNMDGSASEMSRRAQRFARQIEGRYSIKVTMVDERLSSREAKSRAKEQGHRGDYHEDPIDAEAAALIMESWLASR
jgi:putative Holliday junction resolvase